MKNNFIDVNVNDERNEQTNFTIAFTSPGRKDRNSSEMKKVHSSHSMSFTFSKKGFEYII